MVLLLLFIPLVVWAHADHAQLPAGIRCTNIEKSPGIRMDSNTRIFNGHETNWNWPFIVRLGMKDENGVIRLCGATILNKKWIITAGSCAYQRKVVGLIAADEVNGIIEESELRGFAKAVHYHQYYRPGSLANDLALIELEEQFDYNEHLQPACLPKTEPTVGERCFIAGWGMSSTGSIGVETHLLEADIIILSNDICERIFGPYDLWDENEVFCAMGNNGEGSCHGDAGGPVMCVENNEPVLVGIQRKRSTCGGPFLVTKVKSYTNFIRSIVSGQELTRCGAPEQDFKVTFRLRNEHSTNEPILMSFSDSRKC